MCWFIRGAVQGNIDAEALNKINKEHDCHILQGTKHDVKMAVMSDELSFRVTDWCCDCDSDIGEHNQNSSQVIDLSELIAEVGELDGAQNIYICKTWIGQRNKRETALNIAEEDLKQIFADFEPNTLYCFSCKSSS